MKVAILTFHNSPNNAGAVLQAWALQRTLEKLGHEVCVIDYHRKHGDMVPWWSFSTLRGIYYTFKRIPFELVRLYNCRQFCRNYLNLAGTQYGGHINYRDADAFIVGSDQVFNPHHNEMNPNFLLDFVPPGKKRIAYGASFGTDTFSGDYLTMLARHLPLFDALSVREETGEATIRRISGLEAKIVADPTFLLEASEYRSLLNAAKVSLPRTPYVFVYIIGSHSEWRRVAEEIANELGATRIVILTNGRAEWHVPQLGLYRRIHVFTPADFLALISNATYVVTNSFHGTAFSIIFQRQFTSLKNNTAGDDRMNTLLTAAKAGLIGVYQRSSIAFLKEALS